MTTRNPERLVVGLDAATEIVLNDPHRRGAAVRLPARGRLLATGDLHDNPDHLRKIAAFARLDETRDHHVVLHEMIHGERLVNGMDFSHRMLLRVADLIVQHPGQVHPVLANHELAQLTGAGVSKGAGNSVLLFQDAIDFVFGDHAGDVTDALNRFITAMPLIVLSDGGVGCAHSLPSEHAMEHFDPAAIDEPLDPSAYERPHGSAYVMTWGRAYTPAQVARLAETWNVVLFCLGHQHAETGIEIYNEQVIILNSDHERARVVAIDLAQVPTAEEAFLHSMPLSAL